MPAINTFLRWGWLLGVALCAPVTLPAGGGERRYSQIRIQYSSNLFLAEDDEILRSSPITFAPSLRTLDMGTPIYILDSWESEDGGNWIRVKLYSNNLIGDAATARHGWLNVNV